MKLMNRVLKLIVGLGLLASYSAIAKVATTNQVEKKIEAHADQLNPANKDLKLAQWGNYWTNFWNDWANWDKWSDWGNWNNWGNYWGNR